MYKAVYCIITAFILCGVAGCSGDYYRDYLEEQAGFTLPSNSTGEQHFTASDLAFTSHYTLPLDSVDAFAGEAGLAAEPPCRWDPILFAEELPSPWNTIPEEGSYLYGAGTSGWNSWDIVLNTVTGDMWVTVYYTDTSGDPP